MTSLIRILILVSALAATSDSLLCTKCQSENSSCTGEIVKCSSGFECGSAYAENTIDETVTPVFIRSCLNANYCGFTGSMSNRDIWASMTCCNTDNCTPTIPSAPAANTIRNGVVCPFCTSSDSSGCFATYTVVCTGYETTCVHEKTKITGKYLNTSFSAQGCATKSLCNLGSLNISFLDTSFTLDFVCSGGTQSIHKVVLTPAIVCLLLLKLLF